VDDDGTTWTTATIDAAPTADDDARRAGRRWRSLWRVHFYAGVFAAPFLVMMALTGLVILYTQPIQQLTQHDLRVVRAGGDWVSFADQQQAVLDAFPGNSVISVTVPRDATTSTEFALDDDRSVFVDPYTAEVLGTADPGGGIVGFANRLHGTLNNDAVTIPLPTVAGLFGGDWVQDFVVGDMVLEVLGCWTLVLVASGVYLWWPRRTRNGTSRRAGKALLVPRVGARGRARWRDLHAIPGVLFAAGTAFVIVTGMFWSSYWAAGYTALANRVTPNDEVEAPSSGIVTRGDLDRLGNHIPWNSAATAVPDTPSSGGAAPLDIDSVVRIGAEEAMEPGYSVAYPVDDVDEAGNPIYGSWTLTNSWPRKTSEAKAVYLDQFTGQTLGVTDVYGYGAVTVASDTLVSTHMGTQLGLFSRILMTGICLAVLWSVISSVVMYTKRRRSGLGLPRRPRDLKLANGLLVLMVLTGIVYPLWGLSALLVLAVDRFVIRTVPWLRTAFGQR
jgi:uncharacterized iron-regulated membrane protein